MTAAQKLLLTLAFVSAASLGPISGASADDTEPAGVVIEPGDVTSAPTDEGAATNAGGGFDTPADAVETNTGDLEPKPMTIEPNN